MTHHHHPSSQTEDRSSACDCSLFTEFINAFPVLVAHEME